MNRVNRRKLFRLPILPYLLALSIICIGYIGFIGVNQSLYSPDRLLRLLDESKHSVKLVNFIAEFHVCSQDGRCKRLARGVEFFEFPNPIANQRKVNSIKEDIDWVYLTAELDDGQLEKLSANNDLYLYAPESFQSNYFYESKAGSKYTKDASAFFKINRTEILENKKIVLKLKISGIKNFGPKQFPIMLLGEEDVLQFLTVVEKSQNLDNIARALQFSICLLVVVMAFILDHSRIFYHLSLLLTLVSSRILFGFYVENFTPLSSYAVAVEWFSVLLNFSMIVLLPRVFAEIFEISFPTRFYIAQIMAAVGLASFIQYLNDPVLIFVKIGSIADFIAIGYSLLLVSFFVVLRQIKKNSAHRKTDGAKLINLYNAIFLIIVIFCLFAQGYEIFDLDATVNVGLDLANSLFISALVLRSILGIGKTSKAMELHSEDLVNHALTSKDLELGRELQMDLLPRRKMKGDFFEWRAFYYPATQLGGDWYDCQFIDHPIHGPLLVMAIADVTGHGIGAAMMTSAIVSQWSQWIDTIKQSRSELSIIDLPKQAALKVNSGLSTMPVNRGCSMSIAVMNFSKGQLYYVTPGHPGIVLERRGELGKFQRQYLHVKGPRLGSRQVGSGKRSIEQGTSELLPGDMIYLYSDGICSPNVIASTWLKRLNRQAGSSRSISLPLLRGIRDNRKHFQSFREKEDDMTLLIVRVCSALAVYDHSA